MPTLYKKKYFLGPGLPGAMRTELAKYSSLARPSSAERIFVGFSTAPEGQVLLNRYQPLGKPIVCYLADSDALRGYGRPELVGYQWQPLPKRADDSPWPAPWDRCQVLAPPATPNYRDTKNPGDWTWPFLSQYNTWASYAWCRVSDLRQLPWKLIRDLVVQFQSKRERWQYQECNLFENYDPETGESEYSGITSQPTGPQLLTSCADHESFYCRVNGWPLRLIPKPYLRWFAWNREVDGVKLRYSEEKNELLDRVKEYLEQEDLIVRRNIERPEGWEEYEPGLFDWESDWQDFYPSGYWSGQNVEVWNPETKQPEQQEKFVPCGRSTRFQDRGKNMELVAQRSRIDSDPTPEGWQLGLTEDMRLLNWINAEDGVLTPFLLTPFQPFPKPDKDWKAWKRILSHLTWLDGAERKWNKRLLTLSSDLLIDLDPDAPINLDRTEDLQHLDLIVAELDGKTLTRPTAIGSKESRKIVLEPAFEVLEHRSHKAIIVGKQDAIDWFGQWAPELVTAEGKDGRLELKRQADLIVVELRHRVNVVRQLIEESADPLKIQPPIQSKPSADQLIAQLETTSEQDLAWMFLMLTANELLRRAGRLQLGATEIIGQQQDYRNLLEAEAEYKGPAPDEDELDEPEDQFETEEEEFDIEDHFESELETQEELLYASC